ncbi:MAG: SpoIVB peptidase [Ruminococcus sp.]|nr:SpoIVB peptidase [Ruminococcus sp.]MDE6677482.1 SpoIVB peptidase [Ruminococcus sp.]
MKLKRKIIKGTAVILSLGIVGLFGTAEYYSTHLPSSLTTESGSEIRIAEYPQIFCFNNSENAIPVSNNNDGTSQVTLTLFGAIPVKNIEVHEAEAPTLVAGGNPFGIKLLMDGVMVTEMGEVETENGEKICPAQNAGIQVGDIIKSADGKNITSNNEIQEIIGNSNGKKIKIIVSREGKDFPVFLKPEYSESDEKWRGGMWVRDSIAGIGTMTFFNKTTGEFAGLGHPVCDSDTGELVPIYSGEAVPVEITDAKKGSKGIPGELHGQFMYGGNFGILNRNNSCGVYGLLSEQAVKVLCETSEEYKMGYRQDVKTGEAEIMTTISGDTPKKYSIEIEKIDYNSSESTKNMVIRITDKELLESTGGIVQGMSGSPVIQDGKIIGAVTHVFVSDPTKGYAIFAENMAEYLKG